MGVALEQVVRPHDRGVAAGIAAAQPSLLEHGDVGDAVIPGEIVGRRQTMAATTDDDDVIGRLGVGTSPGLRPVRMLRHRIAGEGSDRILHSTVLWRASGSTATGVIAGGAPLRRQIYNKDLML